HATECGDIHGKGWRCCANIRSGRCNAGLMTIAINIDLVTTGCDVQRICPNSGVNFHCAGNHIRKVALRAVHAISQKLDSAATYPITQQIAAVHHGYASGQGGTTGIDEAATVAADTSRIGDDDLCAATRSLDKAIEQAGVLAVDLIQNIARSTTSQVS